MTRGLGAFARKFTLTLQTRAPAVRNCSEQFATARQSEYHDIFSFYAPDITELEARRKKFDK